MPSAARKIKTIADGLVRDVERRLDDKERLGSYDGHTLEHQLEQVSDLMGRLPKVALVDRGNKGR